MRHSSAGPKCFLLLGSVLLLAIAPAAPVSAGDLDAGTRKTLASRRIEPTYRVHAGIDGEICPAFANYASLQRVGDRRWPTVTVTINNPTDAVLRNRVAVRVPGWSDQEIQVAETAADATTTLQFAPSFFPRLYANREIVAATVSVHVTDMAGRTVFATTQPVRLRAAEDMYWGKDFEYAQVIASWVTPHDLRVEQVLSQAKELAPNRRLPGYEEWKTPELQAQSTFLQAKAIYQTLQKKGVSYVKSSATLGRNPDVSERVRLPRESLRHVSANCIDGTVMFASLFENLGLDSTIVLVPGHAYVGLRLAQGTDQYLYIETSLTGRASFAAAVGSARRGLARVNSKEITRIPIFQARRAGIYPMPVPERRGQTAALDQEWEGIYSGTTRSR